MPGQHRARDRDAHSELAVGITFRCRCSYSRTVGARQRDRGQRQLGRLGEPQANRARCGGNPSVGGGLTLPQPSVRPGIFGKPDERAADQRDKEERTRVR